MPTPVVVLHPRRPAALWPALRALGPVHYVPGAPSDGAGLRAARAAHARALAYLAHSSRPSKARALLSCAHLQEDSSRTLLACRAVRTRARSPTWRTPPAPAGRALCCALAPLLPGGGHALSLGFGFLFSCLLYPIAQHNFQARLGEFGRIPVPCSSMASHCS